MRSPDNNNRLPYDSLEMLFAFHVSEKARARREKYLQKFPENLREVEDRRYTLERAVKEVLSETAEVASAYQRTGMSGGAGRVRFGTW